MSIQREQNLSLWKGVTPNSQDTRVLTGQTESHLALLPGSSIRLHQAVVKPFQRLREKAFRAGFELEIVSAFRGFDAQLNIWNQKALGQRPLSDPAGKALEIGNLSALEKIHAILHWSALPGASRHHWGTDMDVIDRLAVPPRYQIQLTPQEVGPGGVFCPLHNWLDRHIGEEGFFRPYQEDLGGVQPERWHLSHGPTSQPLFEAHSAEYLRSALEPSSLLLKEEVLAELPKLFERFFKRVSKSA